MRETLTTLLDVLGLLLLAGGLVGALWPFLGPVALAPGGALVLAGSWLATRGDRS